MDVGQSEEEQSGCWNSATSILRGEGEGERVRERWKSEAFINFKEWLVVQQESGHSVKTISLLLHCRQLKQNTKLHVREQVGAVLMQDMPEEDHMQLLEPPEKKRARYPNWEKQETIVLVKAYQRHMDEFTTATSKGRMPANEQKWDRISSFCSKEEVARDGEQCRKRWQDLSRNYKCIKKWEGASEVQSYWLMSSSSRKDNSLPGNFDREVFNCMDVFMGSKAVVQLFSSKARYDSPDDNQELPSGCLEGRSSALATQVEQYGEPSSQEDSWTLSKERMMPSRDHTKHFQSSQADSGNERGDPIAEAVENAARLAQEQCSAQVTEVLAEVLLKMADAMKTVAENLRKRQR